MNKFRTEISPDPSQHPIAYPQHLMMLGSCFAEHIGAKLLDRSFQIDVNPFGILFNPVSIGSGLHRLMTAEPYTLDDLFVHTGLWHSFDHHSRFSGTDPEEVLDGINKRLGSSVQTLKRISHLFITMGTARVYHHLKTGRVVSNCHKVPAKEFNYQLLRVGDIVRLYTRLFQDLLTVNPQVKIVLTVSPVRYWKDGAHGNQISKSTLLLAVSELVKDFQEVDYFPAYELFMDDLRDYRFYDRDLLHPSEEGIDYVWNKFSSCFFEPKTREIIKRIEKIRKDQYHIPQNPDSDAYKQFEENLASRITSLKSDFPDIEFKF